MGFSQISAKTWRNKTDVRDLVKSVLKKEQTNTILLDPLEGNAKAENTVSGLTATELNNDEGINTLFVTINLVFKNETVGEAHSTFSNFISFNKKDDMSMIDYILELEHLYCKMMEYEMKLPDAVLKLLDGANGAKYSRMDQVKFVEGSL